MNRLLTAGAYALGVAWAPYATAEPSAAPPVMRAAAIESPPLLDGLVLEDPAWNGVEPSSGFRQTRPDEGFPATQRTEVFVAYTPDFLYIAAVCYDDEPSGIINADSRRDSSLVDTDSFQVILDTFRDGQNGFVFGTNPAGIQYDGQVTRDGAALRFSPDSGINLNWDTSWSVVSAISPIGWSTEMAIPFKSLRYPGGGMQSWGINFQRNIRRNNEETYWASLPRQYNLYRVSHAGRVQDVAVPPQRNLKVTPYGLGKAARGGFIDSTDGQGEFGVDLKYSITPSLTLDATYNTDFAQVEADDVQVNLDRFSLFFEEKRPFFLENAGQFSVGTPQEVELFFSRRIGISDGGMPTPIDGGLRLTGKLGARANLGLLHMRSKAVEGAAPRNDFSVARINYELPNRSSIGFMAVNRQGDGSHEVEKDDDRNRTYAIDGRWGIGEDLTLTGWLGKTDTPHRSGDDHAFDLSALYRSEAWSHNLSYSQVAENFNPEVGFLVRTGYRKFSAFTMHRYRPRNLWGLHEVRPHISYNRYVDHQDGLHISSRLHVDTHWEWNSGLEIHTGVNFTHEGVREPFEIVSGGIIPAGSYDEAEAQLVLFTDEAKPLSFAMRSKIGGRFGGNLVNLEPLLRYRIGEKFTSELSWDYNAFDLPHAKFKVNVGRLRATYSFSPNVSIQALVQYDDRGDTLATNLRFAWLQSANAGFYLVYNELDERDLPVAPRRELILKYSRILDLL